MAELVTPNVRFDGIGVTAAGAGEAALALADRLNRWSSEHPNRRILQLDVQSSSTPDGLALTAIIAYVEDADMVVTVATAAAEEPVEATEVVSAAEEIVADAQQEPP